MTLEEMYYDAKFLMEDKSIPNDTEVLITISNAIVGARDSVGISAIYKGIEFESGQIRIEPMKKIYNNILRMDSPAGIVREEFGGVSFNACGKCHMKVAKDDLYCRHCGQRLR